MKHENNLISESRRLLALGRPYAFYPHKMSAAGFGHRFFTEVDGDLRTEGVVLDRPDRSALDIEGLDLDMLGVAAASRRQASASGKLLLVGNDGVATWQMHPGRSPEVAFCGQATLAVAAAIGRRFAAFDLMGPRGRRARVVQQREGTFVNQRWHLEDFPVFQACWSDRIFAKAPALNDIVVMLGLPNGVSAAEARREIFPIDRLTNKLVVVERQDHGPPRVVTETAAGQHGAIPASVVATLSALSRRSVWFHSVLKEGVIVHPSKSGDVQLVLPEVHETEHDGLSIELPGADVFLTPLLEAF